MTALKLHAAVRPRIKASLTVRVNTGQLEPYEGSYTITPGRESITLQTANKRMTNNLTVNPIPQNYGLITYNGYELTVS